jgi:hypothetical protein
MIRSAVIPASQLLSEMMVDRGHAGTLPVRLKKKEHLNDHRHRIRTVRRRCL